MGLSLSPEALQQQVCEVGGSISLVNAAHLTQSRKLLRLPKTSMQ
jgi:hypothetical protein